MTIKEDIIELYSEIINGEKSEIEKTSRIYWKEYEKILDKLWEEYQFDIMNGIPYFLEELVEDFKDKNSRLILKSTEIKTIERGLKKIMRESKIEIPEKNQRFYEKNNQPIIQNILAQNQSVNNEINISIENKINSLYQQFEKELNKQNPDKLKLKDIIKTILKILGFIF